ncbi:30S ribosomal protein S14 [Natrarchaeobius chitinivorans]|uniref:30S ribosomal protein S14 n=1 Tax=Natrarchaeobius chitinivorans TaxID=1679083 RepID=A0A3N6MJ44_NATCH|nr:30S ribosomal protein S14 [Natrarchaeobius chitinivorans]RQG95801.1 30S ribosomal protein S14 [Natrarchaeobius chitinivorans]
MTARESGDDSNESTAAASADSSRTGTRHVCRDTGREQGLIGKYDIWLCRQSFREMARDIGFRKYD